MPDREKVIEGLERCTNHRFGGIERCVGCPYEDEVITCRGDMLEDALSLLKEYVYGTRYVPVVRCYECRHWEPENAEEGDCSGHCRKRYGMSEGATTDGTWFCSDGEKEET